MARDHDDRPSKRTRGRRDDDYEEEDERPARKRRARDEDEEEDRPRRKSSGSVLPLVLGIGGGLLGVGLVVVVIVVLINNGTFGKKDGPAGNTNTNGKTDGTKDGNKGPGPVDDGWSPAAGKLDQLEAERPIVAGYHMRIPKGLTVQHFGRAAGSGGGKYHVGPAQPNPANPPIFVEIAANLDQGTVEFYTKDPTYQTSQGIVPLCSALGYSNVQPGAIESGTLAGSKFFRARVTGTDKMGRKMTGFYYRGFRGNDMIVMQCFATEPATKDTLDLMEAAVLTLRK